MSSRGILRRASPTKTRNLSTRMQSRGSYRDVLLLNHNREDNTENVHGESDIKSEYYKPTMNTALRMGNRIEQLNDFNVELAKNPNELTPRSKAVVTDKALKKLNFGPNMKAYKQLPPINVNDSLLVTNKKKRSSNFKKDGSTMNDPEPNLTKYLRPSEIFNPTFDLPSMSFSDDENDSEKLSPNENFQMLYRTYQVYFNPDAYNVRPSIIYDFNNDKST